MQKQWSILFRVWTLKPVLIPVSRHLNFPKYTGPEYIHLSMIMVDISYNGTGPFPNIMKNLQIFTDSLFNTSTAGIN